jgi:hypothetical protein
MITKTIITITASILCYSVAFAAPLADYGFKSPSFTGSGYSSHVLTIENQEATRRKAVQDQVQAALDKAANDAKNTNLQKFLNNLESRVYAQISQNLATAMFATGGTTAGTLNFEGNTIAWTRDNANVYLNVTDLNGTVTQITVPLGQFQFN